MMRMREQIKWSASVEPHSVEPHSAEPHSAEPHSTALIA